MSPEPKGRDLFIVDNSVSGWTGLRYLEEWTEIARAFDIATGCFEIGGLLELDEKWQRFEKIRILMGSDTTSRTRRALFETVRSHAVEVLDESIEEDKEANPYLHGVPAILHALRSGQIECRVYDKDKFHAKVKSSQSAADVNVLRALQGTMSTFKGEQGLLVSWGGFTSSALTEARQHHFSVRLWDGSDLLSAVLENYDRLPEELRSDLPLKRIWALVLEE